MTRPARQLEVSADTTGNVCLLTVDGVLDSSTYLQLRDAIIKAALDDPRAVLVDVNGLDVRASSAWSVFTSARWHVSTWPDVPIMLVCAHGHRRSTIKRNGVTRYVPAHATVEAALAALTDSRRARRRTRADLPASLVALRMARKFAAEWLGAWSQSELIAVATVIVNVFVENVLQHTASAPVLVLESDGATVTISVQDGSSTPAARHEDPYRGGDKVSGGDRRIGVPGLGQYTDAVRKDGVGRHRPGKSALARPRRCGPGGPEEERRHQNRPRRCRQIHARGAIRQFYCRFPRRHGRTASTTDRYPVVLLVPLDLHQVRDFADESAPAIRRHAARSDRSPRQRCRHCPAVWQTKQQSE